jgi:glutathione S-transferase
LHANKKFIFRLGSGSFAEGHKVGIEDRDDSKYSILRLGNRKQIVETCAIDSPPILKRGPIVLYEFEGCPFCRKVREAVSMLSLEVEFRPCPQGSSFRREIKEEYGSSSTFPFMRDPNTGVEMFESDDIIRYLYRTYGVGEPPASLQKGILNTLTAGFGLVFRVNRGNKRKNSDPPKLPLILWSCEGPSFTKLVKEELCELQIAHVQISCPRGSPQRQRLFEKTGRFQIPYLEDPNTGVSLFESSAIIEYLNAMYAVEEPFIKYM